MTVEVPLYMAQDPKYATRITTYGTSVFKLMCDVIGKAL